MSIISTSKEIASNTAEYTKDAIKNIKRWAQYRWNVARNHIFRTPQTLEYYWISLPTNKDLIEALKILHSDLHNPFPIQQNTSKQLIRTLEVFNPSLTTQKISEQLIATLQKKNFPLDVEKMENLYERINWIEIASTDSEEERKEKKDKIAKILSELSSQDKLSLSKYVHTAHFYKTQIKDWNSIEHLTVSELQKSMPPHPGEFPIKPTREHFSSKSEYVKALADWNKEKINRNKQYKMWKERSCYIKLQDDTSKYIRDLWIRNRVTNFWIKCIAALPQWFIWKWIPDRVDKEFHPNILEMSPEEERDLRHMILDLKNWENFFIMLNHETFANIPTTIMKIMQVARDEWIENINKYLYTVIWDLIEINTKQEPVINMISNIIPTTPATNNIPWAKVIAKQRRENCANQIRKTLVPEDNIKKSKTGKIKWKSSKKKNGRGNIVLCAPSGTRDVIHRTKDWKCFIFTPDERQTSNKTTLPFIRELATKWVHIISTSTNTAEFKKPNPNRWVTTNNDEWNPGATMTIHFQELDINNMTNKEIIEAIADRITQPIPIYEEIKIEDPSDGSIKSYMSIKWYTEEPCGITIPWDDIFPYIKSLTKDTEYSTTWSLPENIFIDENKWELNFELIRERIREKEAQKKLSQNKA